MSIWTILNYGAWALSAILLLAMLRDFIKVEREARANRKPEDPDLPEGGAS